MKFSNIHFGVKNKKTKEESEKVDLKCFYSLDVKGFLQGDNGGTFLMQSVAIPNLQIITLTILRIGIRLTLPNKRVKDDQNYKPDFLINNYSAILT